MIKTAFMYITCYPCEILMKLEFYRRIFKKYSNTKFRDYLFSRNRVVSCGGGQTDRHDEVSNRSLQFCEKFLKIILEKHLCNFPSQVIFINVAHRKYSSLPDLEKSPEVWQWIYFNYRCRHLRTPHLTNWKFLLQVPSSSSWRSWRVRPVSFFLDPQDEVRPSISSSVVLFLRPFGLYCSVCFDSLFVSILCTRCSNFSWYCFISFTMFCAPVICLMYWCKCLQYHKKNINVFIFTGFFLSFKMASS